MKRKHQDKKGKIQKKKSLCKSAEEKKQITPGTVRPFFVSFRY
jgi:hypothetical protein